MKSCSKCKSNEVLETTGLDLNNEGQWIIGDTKIYCIVCGHTSIVKGEN